jgi:hypothetical protein
LKSATKSVEPAVVVVVPEHTGEAQRRPDDAEGGRDVDERAVAAVPVQPGGAVHVRTKESRPAVVVVVAPRADLFAQRSFRTLASAATSTNVPSPWL